MLKQINPIECKVLQVGDIVKYSGFVFSDRTEEERNKTFKITEIIKYYYTRAGEFIPTTDTLENEDKTKGYLFIDYKLDNGKQCTYLDFKLA